jgi:hypothetical protein
MHKPVDDSFEDYSGKADGAYKGIARSTREDYKN